MASEAEAVEVLVEAVPMKEAILDGTCPQVVAEVTQGTKTF